ncbi:Oxoglutarate/iron-dependent dioxygenase [Naviculisporaceae sp. PSN 640]
MTTTMEVRHDSTTGLDIVQLQTIELARIVADDPQERKRLYVAAARPGGFLLDFRSSHNDIIDTVEQLYALSDRYFARPDEEKSRDARHDQLPSQDRGYKRSDCDETFEFADDELCRGDTELKLPAVLQEKTDLVRKFNQICHSATMSMLSSLSDSMGLRGDQRFETYHRTDDTSDTGLKLIREPTLASAADVVENKHTDSGTFTLLFYERLGLHVYLPEEDRWEYAPVPAPGCALVTVADSLQRLSGGQFHSPLHRVTQPRDGADKRFYLSYFLRPSHATKAEWAKQLDVGNGN